MDFMELPLQNIDTVMLASVELITFTGTVSEAILHK